MHSKNIGAFEFCRGIMKKQSLGDLIAQPSFLSGGCINTVARLQTANQHIVIKWNEEKNQNFFEIEKKGLELLRSTKTIGLPEVLGIGTYNEVPYLLLSYHHSDKRNSTFWEDFGHQLAELHKTTTNKFGLEYHNFIGGIEQSNTQHRHWHDFFREERLNFQAKIALKSNKLPVKTMAKLEAMYTKLPSLLPEGEPSLLHGDLWSGNFITGNHGEAILIDPAVYYGHREIEIAFTRLFGGFDENFYRAYQSTWPLDESFSERIDLYNLYSLLVHLNLFGSSYLSGIHSTLDKYV